MSIFSKKSTLKSRPSTPPDPRPLIWHGANVVEREHGLFYYVDETSDLNGPYPTLEAATEALKGYIESELQSRQPRPEGHTQGA